MSSTNPWRFQLITGAPSEVTGSPLRQEKVLHAVAAAAALADPKAAVQIAKQAEKDPQLLVNPQFTLQRSRGLTRFRSPEVTHP
jgi:hypothetical protein